MTEIEEDISNIKLSLNKICIAIAHKDFQIQSANATLGDFSQEIHQANEEIAKLRKALGSIMTFVEEDIFGSDPNKWCVTPYFKEAILSAREALK